MTDTYTEDTYTEAQIREAINTAAHSVTEKDVWVVPDLVIAELTKPAYMPKVGVVGMYRHTPKDPWLAFICREGCYYPNEMRALTKTECGPVGEALGLAIDALKEELRITPDYQTEAKKLHKALSEIKKLTGDL